MDVGFSAVGVDGGSVSSAVTKEVIRHADVHGLKKCLAASAVGTTVNVAHTASPKVLMGKN